MPDFRPFSALRYASTLDPAAVLAPPYDVLSSEDVRELQARDPYNVTHIDLPENQDYARAAALLDDWLARGVLVGDEAATLSIYRMAFRDAAGAERTVVGVLGGLSVEDEPSAVRPEGVTTVLPHEQVTAKASTDRWELTKATAANLSPVWGLSLASGLTEALREEAEVLGRVEVDGVTHTLERLSDPDRVATIRAILASDDVLIADGHHRYGVARRYRDQVRAATGRTDTPAEQALAFVNELVEDQISIEAIHRLYSGISPFDFARALERCFAREPLESVTPTSLTAMVERARLVLLWPNGSAEWLVPLPGAFEGLRALDGLWLEAALAGFDASVTYQHGFAQMADCVASGDYVAGILIRPTSIAEIRRTAREGILMPPKSTFFTPKLLTGWVIRPTEPLPVS